MIDPHCASACLNQSGVANRAFMPQVYNADQYTNISLIVPQPSNFSATISPWVAEVAPMKASGKIAGTNYTLYTGSWLASNESAPQHPFDVLATGPKGSASSTFNSWGDVPFVL